MCAQTRLLTIYYLSIMLPWRWLAGKTHTLAECGWDAACMGRVLCALRVACLRMKSTPALILSYMYMMGIFGDLRDALLPFKAYYEFLLRPRQIKVVNRHSGTRIMQMRKLREEAFHPKLKTNIGSSTLVLQLNAVFIDVILMELESKKPGKVDWRYVSEWMGPHSYVVMKDKKICLV